MNIIEVQLASEILTSPNQQQIQAWVDTALLDYDGDTEVVVRIVDEQESAYLNEQYRQRQGATNVLSFPFELPKGIPGIEIKLLGDLVICAPVIEREALEQQKPLDYHWAHMVVHGILHLIGYDHNHDEEATIMENKEIEIMKKLNINNPYYLHEVDAK